MHLRQTYITTFEARPGMRLAHPVSEVFDNRLFQLLAGHHDPDSLPANAYVMAVHLAEMTCNALDLGKRQRNLVANLSEQALPQLGLNWTHVPHLLGEIEARARFMRAFAGIKAN